MFYVERQKQGSASLTTKPGPLLLSRQTYQICLFYKLTKIHLETALISSHMQLLSHEDSFRTLFL